MKTFKLVKNIIIWEQLIVWIGLQLFIIITNLGKNDCFEECVDFLCFLFIKTVYFDFGISFFC